MLPTIQQPLRIIAFVIPLLGLSALSAADPPPEVAKLITQLKDPDESVRLKAAKELGKLKEKAKDAIPALTAAATDSDEDVRLVAKKALSTIKEATTKSEAVKIDEKLVPLIKDMRSKENKVRLAAIAKLEEIGSDAKAAGPALVEFGIMSPNAAVREAATEAFEKIDPLVFKEIITVLYDEDINKKDRAVMSLELMGRKALAAVPILKGYHSYLLGKDKRTPGNTLQALVKIAPEDEGVQRVILDLVGGPQLSQPRQRGVNGNLGSPNRELTIVLMQELKIDDKQKLAPLVAGLAQTHSSASAPGGGPGGGRPSRPGELDRSSESERELMIKILGQLSVEDKDKLSALMAALAKSTTERALIVAEIGKLGPAAKTALPVLMKLKTDKEEAVRVAANAAIEAIKE